ncbi:MAG: exodeoxyribonuclease VII small subunit [Bacteroidota bacterium]
MAQTKQTKKVEIASFEESLKRLEEIVEKLEGGSVPLEEALNLYEEGVKISKECISKLTQAEIRLKTIMKDVGGEISIREEDEADE